MALKTVEIDEELLRHAMEAAEAHDARELIEDQLKEIVQYREAQRRLLQLRGKVEWDGNLDQMRRNRPQAEGDW